MQRKQKKIWTNSGQLDYNLVIRVVKFYMLLRKDAEILIILKLGIKINRTIKLSQIICLFHIVLFKHLKIKLIKSKVNPLKRLNN